MKNDHVLITWHQPFEAGFKFFNVTIIGANNVVATLSPKYRVGRMRWNMREKGNIKGCHFEGWYSRQILKQQILNRRNYCYTNTGKYLLGIL